MIQVASFANFLPKRKKKSQSLLTPYNKVEQTGGLVEAYFYCLALVTWQIGLQNTNAPANSGDPAIPLATVLIQPIFSFLFIYFFFLGAEGKGEGIKLGQQIKWKASVSWLGVSL